MDLPNLAHVVSALEREHGTLGELAKALKMPQGDVQNIRDRVVVDPPLSVAMNICDVAISWFGMEKAKHLWERL